MKVLKFGGGCLKDADSIKKLPSILKKYDEDIIIVISSFGKLTNLLEDILSKNPVNFNPLKEVFKQIMYDLSFDEKKISQVLNATQPVDSSDAAILSIGELMSSQILSHYLSKHFINHTLVNAIDIIKTSNMGINASVHWEETHYEAKRLINQDNCKTILTQGFISSFSKNEKFQITCLGREGSDYSAAILGHVFDAKEVVLFKDVDGIYSSDPKKKPTATLFHHLTYDDAFELCKNRNTVIHPKTMEPLKEKSIPLVIKNFNNLSAPGTLIS